MILPQKTVFYKNGRNREPIFIKKLEFVEERDFMKLEYATGFYNISFFNINIKTKEELTQNILKKEEATFTHEFIHYLQDLILPYNIRYNLSNVRYFF